MHPSLDTGCSRMLLLLQQNRTFLNMNPVVWLRDPDRVFLSILAGEVLTDTDLINAESKNLQAPLTNLLNNSLGDSSAGVGPEAVDGVEVPVLVFLNHVHTSPINDNYGSGPNSVQVSQVQLDPEISQVLNKLATQTVVKPVVHKTVNLDVCDHVANHAHTVSFTVPSQKKGLSPDLLWNKIKHVFLTHVSPCLFAPLFHNVPNVVKGQSVGGRLQEFWLIWQEMGANPRVVSVLRDGYTLPFKQRPPLTRSPLIQSGYENPSRNRSLKEGIAHSDRQVGSGKSGCQVFPCFLQPAFPGSETQQKMETNLGSQSVQSLPQSRYLQNGNPGNNPLVFAKRRMGNFAGLQRRVVPHSHQSKVKKVPQVLPEQSDLPIHSSAFWVGDSSLGIYKGGQRSETHGTNKGYPDLSVPGRLVAESPMPGDLPTTYPDPVSVGWLIWRNQSVPLSRTSTSLVTGLIC